MYRKPDAKAMKTENFFEFSQCLVGRRDQREMQPHDEVIPRGAELKAREKRGKTEENRLAWAVLEERIEPCSTRHLAVGRQNL